jgi:hypothetical protein
MMSKITESARGKQCQLRLEGCLSPNTETTVFAHLNGAGMAMKQRINNFDFGFYSCANCHDLYDGRISLAPPIEKEWLELQVLRAVIKTQMIMAKNGVI